jgi:DNA-binding NarL/FixJ family response regulator
MPVRILIADDHALVRGQLRAALEEQIGFEIAGEAATGVEAVAMAHALQPDVVIMDVMMPDMDGIEATRVIHAAQPAIVILAWTTLDGPDVALAMGEAGASAFFHKTSHVHTLITRLRSIEMAAHAR